ncbi:MAG: type II toxin-antitoxin system RelE/ParE family toxin [Chloroflexi bacterium]|nr:type II toxin-antitoxin system RelE/ParE family toxin [Chloroflexota bacterium]
MAWTIEYTRRAQTQLGRLDRRTARRIIDYMEQRIAESDNPRNTGRAMRGPLRGFWRYRVGDYRLICDIQDNVLTVLVLRVGRRDQIYR